MVRVSPEMGGRREEKSVVEECGGWEKKVLRSGVGRELVQSPWACGISEPSVTRSTLHPTSDLQLSNRPDSTKPRKHSLSRCLSFSLFHLICLSSTLCLTSPVR